MSSGYRLMAHLASITAIKDTQLRELSLLKTLQAVFKPNTLLLVKLNTNNQPLFLLRYDSKANLIKNDGAAHLCSNTQSLIMNTLTKKHLTATIPQQSETITFFSLFDLFNMNLCFVLKNANALSADNISLISSFLDVYRNFCLLIEDVQTDQLTGLLNRKTFEENFQHISEKLLPESIINERSTLPVESQGYWMAVIDIDDFKRINDTFGHVYGDEVLILLARLMKNCFRSDDQLYRFGGEEFVIITKCKNLQGAHFVFERLRKTIEEYNFPQIGCVTVSIGVVQLQTKILATALFDQADQALYYVKKHGKNQVKFYQALVDSGLLNLVKTLSGDIELF